MTQQELTIRMLPLREIIPAPYNPRRPLLPTSPAYQKLKRSIERFGLVEPLIWNQRSRHLIGGHARLAILQELGHDPVPVTVVDLDEPSEKALNIVLNNQEAQGRYDPSKLAELLNQLLPLPEFADTGFDERFLRTLEMQPLEELPEVPRPDRVEVTFLIPREVYPRLAPVLDDLIRTHDLQVRLLGL